MTLKDALGFVIDYSKFIATLWAAYVGVITAMIGWLVTLRSRDLPLDDPARMTLIAAFVGVSLVFIAVLHENNRRLVNLMNVVDALAEIEGKKPDQPGETYRRVFQTGSTGTFLKLTAFLVVPLITVLVSLFICLITSPK